MRFFLPKKHGMQFSKCLHVINGLWTFKENYRANFHWDEKPQFCQLAMLSIMYGIIWLWFYGLISDYTLSIVFSVYPPNNLSAR